MYTHIGLQLRPDEHVEGFHRPEPVLHLGRYCNISVIIYVYIYIYTYIHTHTPLSLYIYIYICIMSVA